MPSNSGKRTIPVLDQWFDHTCQESSVDDWHLIHRCWAFNLARPGRRNLHNLSSGVGPFPFQDSAATIFTIANTGAMLMFGQERSREYAALAAEPGCASDSSWTELLPAFRAL